MKLYSLYSFPANVDNTKKHYGAGAVLQCGFRLRPDNVSDSVILRIKISI
jgi:hypothetical protein